MSQTRRTSDGTLTPEHMTILARHAPMSAVVSLARTDQFNRGIGNSAVREHIERLYAAFSVACERHWARVSSALLGQKIVLSKLLSADAENQTSISGITLQRPAAAACVLQVGDPRPRDPRPGNRMQFIVSYRNATLMAKMKGAQGNQLAFDLTYKLQPVAVLGEASNNANEAIPPLPSTYRQEIEHTIALFNNLYTILDILEPSVQAWNRQNMRLTSQIAPFPAQAREIYRMFDLDDFKTQKIRILFRGQEIERISLSNFATTSLAASGGSTTSLSQAGGAPKKYVKHGARTYLVRKDPQHGNYILVQKQKVFLGVAR